MERQSTSASYSQASCFHLTTFLKCEATETLLAEWRNQHAGKHYLGIEPIHDVDSVLQKIDAPDNGTVVNIKELLEKSRNTNLPQCEQLGTTTILVVEVPEISQVDFGKELLECSLESLPHGKLQGDIDVYLNGDDCLILVCCSESSQNVLDFVNKSLRQLETMRHKVSGQYARYREHYQQGYIDAGKMVDVELECFELSGTTVENFSAKSIHLSPEVTTANATIQVMEKMTHAYQTALRFQGNVSQIEAMLQANIRNLSEICKHIFNVDFKNFDSEARRLFQRRIALLEMRVEQVRVDQGLVNPSLKAAKSVAQLCHSQILAKLASIEAKENQLRMADEKQKDAHNFRIMLLGMWIGLTQLVIAWVALLPNTSRPTGGKLFIWIIAPTIVCLIPFLYRFITVKKH